MHARVHCASFALIFPNWIMFTFCSVSVRAMVYGVCAGSGTLDSDTSLRVAQIFFYPFVSLIFFLIIFHCAEALAGVFCGVIFVNRSATRWATIIELNEQ